MIIPKKLHRTTNHRKPRHQLWQPGFNRHNSCWLEGRWIDIGARTDEDLSAMVEAHEALYANIREETKRQHHRGNPRPSGA